MRGSLSALLPVFNQQRRVGRLVHELLDVLGDLTERFEIVLVDDGSQDATIEEADALIGHYPQLRVVRHGRQRGRLPAIQAALARSSGHSIFLPGEDGAFSAGDIPRMWHALGEMDLVLARPATVLRAARWRRPAPQRPSGMLMARRTAVEVLFPLLSDMAGLRAHLAEHAYRWRELHLAHPTPPAARYLQTGAGRGSRHEGAEAHGGYLARVREFLAGS